MEESLDNLAYDFFRQFARFEYALKASGFHNGNNKAAEAHWTNFARSVENTLSEQELNKPESAKVKEAVDFILNKPPKKQYINANGDFEWRDVVPNHVSRADLILLYVRRVRNNLFHGGKFNVAWFDPDRSGTLIKHSSAILDECLHASPQVLATYFS